MEKNEKFFENYQNIQFLKLDINQHYKFKNLFKERSINKEEIIAITYDSNMSEINVIYNDFIQSLDAIMDHDYDNRFEFSLDAHWFEFEGDSFLKTIILEFFAQIFAFKTLMLLAALFFGYF